MFTANMMLLSDSCRLHVNHLVMIKIFQPVSLKKLTSINQSMLNNFVLSQKDHKN